MDVDNAFQPRFYSKVRSRVASLEFNYWGMAEGWAECRGTNPTAEKRWGTNPTGKDYLAAHQPHWGGLAERQGTNPNEEVCRGTNPTGEECRGTNPTWEFYRGTNHYGDVGAPTPLERSVEGPTREGVSFKA